MANSSAIRQKPSAEAIEAIRALLYAPVLKSRHLRPASDIAAPLRGNRGKQAAE